MNERMMDMKAPQIDHMMRFLRSGEMCLDDNSLQLVSAIYQELDRLSPCGDDHRHELWLEAERGKIRDFGDFEDWQADDESLTKADFRAEWERSYPADTKYFYKLTTVEHLEYRSLFMNGHLIIAVEPDRDGCRFDISEFLTWILESVRNVVQMVKAGTYTSYLEENLPYRYRTGVMPLQEYWKLYPEEKAYHFRRISEKDCLEFDRLISGPDGVPKDRIEKMTVNKYLDFCMLGYQANRMEGCNEKTPAEMYKRYADDRDGGLLMIDRDSAEAFDRWYGLSDTEKWKIENPSHTWEVIQGGSLTRMYMFVCKDERGYYLSLSANEYCCPEYAVWFYLKLTKNGIPIEFPGGRKIADYLCGRCKVAFIPVFYNGPDFYYGGMDDPEIMQFVNLPEEKTEEAIKKAEWYPLMDLKLKTNGPHIEHIDFS